MMFSENLWSRTAQVPKTACSAFRPKRPPPAPHSVLDYVIQAARRVGILNPLAAITRGGPGATGRNAFAHEAGIHQDAMIKNALTYEIMTPHSVGVPTTGLVLGKHSGRHALGLRCEELGYR